MGTAGLLGGGEVRADRAEEMASWARSNTTVYVLSAESHRSDTVVAMAGLIAECLHLDRPSPVEFVVSKAAEHARAFARDERELSDRSRRVLGDLEKSARNALYPDGSWDPLSGRPQIRADEATTLDYLRQAASDALAILQERWCDVLGIASALKVRCFLNPNDVEELAPFLRQV